MENCVDHENIYYCTVNDKFIVGTDSKTYGNAIVERPLQSHIFIPKTVNGNEVKEIGAYAFIECATLSEVTIEARIVRINQHAFCRCCRLTRINIPNTCVSIDPWGLQTFNISSPNDYNNVYKSLNIYFEPNSKLKTIGQAGIACRETVNIFFCERVDVKIEREAFDKTTYLNVYSPSSFAFYGKRTITKGYSSLCAAPRTCFIRSKAIFRYSLIFSVLLFS